MKAILKYNLDNPDDERLHKLSIMSNDMALVLWEMIINGPKKARNEFQYNKHDDDIDVLDTYMRYFINMLEDFNINIDELG